MAGFGTRAICVDGSFQQPRSVWRLHCLCDGRGSSLAVEIPGQAGNDESGARNDEGRVRKDQILRQAQDDIGWDDESAGVDGAGDGDAGAAGNHEPGRMAGTRRGHDGGSPVSAAGSGKDAAAQLDRACVCFGFFGDAGRSLPAEARFGSGALAYLADGVPGHCCAALDGCRAGNGALGIWRGAGGLFQGEPGVRVAGRGPGCGMPGVCFQRVPGNRGGVWSSGIVVIVAAGIDFNSHPAQGQEPVCGGIDGLGGICLCFVSPDGDTVAGPGRWVRAHRFGRRILAGPLMADGGPARHRRGAVGGMDGLPGQARNDERMARNGRQRGFPGRLCTGIRVAPSGPVCRKHGSAGAGITDELRSDV